MDIVNERDKALARHKLLNGVEYRYTVARAVCKDGFSVSIQAGETLYSTPRANRAWPYAEFELGFPSAADDLIQEYAEDPEKPTGTVYGWVPVETVVALIEKHGGLIESGG